MLKSKSLFIRVMATCLIAAPSCSSQIGNAAEPSVFMVKGINKQSVSADINQMKVICQERFLSGQDLPSVDSILVPLRYYSEREMHDEKVIMSLCYGSYLSKKGLVTEALEVYNDIIADEHAKKIPYYWGRLLYERACLLETVGLYIESAIDYRESRHWMGLCSEYPGNAFSSDYCMALLGESRCSTMQGDKLFAESLIDSCSSSISQSEKYNIPVSEELIQKYQHASLQLREMQDLQSSDFAMLVGIAQSIRDTSLQELDDTIKYSMSQHMFMIVLSSFFIVVLITLSALWYGRARKRRKMIRDLRSEYDSLLMTCRSGTELSKEVLNLMNERVLVINELLSGKIRQGKTFYSSLERLSGNRTEILESIAILYAIHSPGFVSILFNKKLSPAEIGFCYLLLSGLSVKQVGSFICHSDYYSISSKIRSKLGIESNASTLGKWLKLQESTFNNNH